MTQEQKAYIEQNIDLIRDNRWEEFFKNAPSGIGAPLYIAGIDFMSHMKEVPPTCFEDSNIESITIPNNITSIGEDAFYICASLTSVTIGDGVTIIGSNAFRSCTSLTSVTIPNSVTSIGDSAFRWCYSLTSVTIGDSVTSIGEYAFAYCISLRTVSFTGTMEQWGQITQNKDAFTNVPVQEVVCSDGVTTLRG